MEERPDRPRSSAYERPWLVLLMAAALVATGATATPAVGAGTTDVDGDNVDDALEGELCGNVYAREVVEATDGTCVSHSDLDPPARTTLYSAWDHPVAGTDADGDGLPASATVEGERIRLDPASGAVERTPLAPAAVVLDHDDANPEVPAGPAVCRPLAAIMGVASGDDQDGDGLPSRVVALTGELCADVRYPSDPTSLNPTSEQWDGYPDPDPWDEDHAPAGWHMRIPLDAAPGPDLDRDGIPARVDWVEAHIAFEPGDAVEPTAERVASEEVWDEVDTDPHDPVPHLPVDADGDRVPDGAEPHLCLNENPSTTVDGWCGGPLYSDYTPPCTWPQRGGSVSAPLRLVSCG